MSSEWRALFEIVSGHYDGLTFVVAHDGIHFGDEITALRSAPLPRLDEFDDVEFEVGGDGVKLTCKEGSFALNGAQVTGTRRLSPGDIAGIGPTEVLLADYESSPSNKEVP